MNARDLLIAARAKIEKPEAWTQGSAAKDENGVPMLPNSRYACQWCSVGAIAVATAEAYEQRRGGEPHRFLLWGEMETLRQEASSALAQQIKYWDGQAVRYCIADFNDARHRKHADVLAAFDKAIASLEGA